MALEIEGTAGRVFRRLRDVGTPEEMWAEAGRGVCLPGEPAMNAHIHLPPNFSAFDTVEEAVASAAREGLRLLGASNYYDYSLYPTFAERALAHGIYPLFGLELICMLEEERKAGVRVNDPANPGRMYLCGKGITGFDPMMPEAERLLRVMRRRDERRIRRMTERLSAVFAQRGHAVELDAGQVVANVVKRHGGGSGSVTLQERHVAQAFQQEIFRRVHESRRPAVLAGVLGVLPGDIPADGPGLQNLIRSSLMKTGKPAFVEESFLGFSETCALILELGGVPCYPTLADGASPVCAYEDPPERLIQALADRRIFCAEFIPPRNHPEVLGRYVHAMRRAGLVVTAGTEHNTLDRAPMIPSCARNFPVPESVREIFMEGAYVVAAHQYLRLHGRCGYVDGRGELNPEFADTETRIDAFRGLGAAVVARQLSPQSHEKVGADHGLENPLA